MLNDCVRWGGGGGGGGVGAENTSRSTGVVAEQGLENEWKTSFFSPFSFSPPTPFSHHRLLLCRSYSKAARSRPAVRSRLFLIFFFSPPPPVLYFSLKGKKRKKKKKSSQILSAPTWYLRRQVGILQRRREKGTRLVPRRRMGLHSETTSARVGGREREREREEEREYVCPPFFLFFFTSVSCFYPHKTSPSPP